MPNYEDIITEISLKVLVNGELKELEMPVPFDYEGGEILQLLMDDVDPLDPDMELIGETTADDPDLLEALEDGDIAGGMDPDAFEDWSLRARDLQEIDWEWDALDEAGLTPGVMPGIYDLRTGKPTVEDLDETIEHDLANARIVANEGKAAFRMMRETSGASQADLAEALGVNPRTVKRWETPGQPEPPHDAWSLVEGWYHDALSGAHWHVRRAEELRDDYHEAYTLVLYRNQGELDRALSPILAQAPSYHWQDALAEARERAIRETGDDSHLEINHPYTNFPGTRSYWRANAAARLASILMSERKIPHGFAYAGESRESLNQDGVWVPRAGVQRIETSSGQIVVCGMR